MRRHSTMKKVERKAQVTYESPRFEEHHKVRLSLLKKLLDLGWRRHQIICPSPDSDDREWRVPKNPSSAAQRERGRAFDGFPCDVAIFDSEGDCGDWNHLSIIIECKAPDEDAGISELEIYLGLEPRAKLGIWTNGRRTLRVYKLPSGEFHVERNASLPRPGENILLAERSLRYDGLKVPTLKELTATFSLLLNLIVASDGRTTRPDARLNQVCNLILIKLESDSLARRKPGSQVQFQVSDSPAETTEVVNALFRRYRDNRRDLFGSDEPDVILFDEGTIQAAVSELQMLDLADVKPAVLSLAFQVFKSANLKVGDGQYFTPTRVIEAGTRMMCIDSQDKVIDPACGTGGFLSEAFLAVAAGVSEADAIRWANGNLYGVDRDDINVKLTRALMVGVGDGSTHVKYGDSIREGKWREYGHALEDALADGSYSVVLTNPPFGKDLKVSATDASSGRFSICQHTSGGKRSSSYAATEIGIVFVERAWRLLRPGGRLGIVLPETYFFSSTYEWFRAWVDEHFELKGVLNIPMEAFQGFCRAKTNFYVLMKRGSTPVAKSLENQPLWFVGDQTWVSNAPTIGINKDGDELFVIDPTTHRRLEEIDDVAARDVEALVNDTGDTQTARFVPTTGVSESLIGVPQYHDRTVVRAFERWVSDKLPGCVPLPLGELARCGQLLVRAGHGSPSADFRNGDVPYIKVSDLRNRQVNVNSTNMVPRAVAERFWRGKGSGLLAWDVVTPARASKNIGEPVMLLPGQEDVVLTKEVLVLRPSDAACFDGFYLAWALSLPLVLRQWGRVVFMQTNREDLGDRWREIEIPVPGDAEAARRLAAPFERYYRGLSDLQATLRADMRSWDGEAS